MARAQLIKKARKPIYANGLQVTKTHKTGKKAGQDYQERDRSQPADDSDVIIINVGESYYWWQFMYGTKQVSKTRPRNSQLTQSDFLSRAYGMLERLEDLTSDDDLETFKDEMTSEIEELRDEQEEKKENMPEGLQESPTGELLQERYDALEEFYNEIEQVEVEVDESEFEYDPDAGENDTEETTEEEEKAEWIAEKKQEIVEEFQNISLEV